MLSRLIEYRCASDILDPASLVPRLGKRICWSDEGVSRRLALRCFLFSGLPIRLMALLLLLRLTACAFPSEAKPPHLINDRSIAPLCLIARSCLNLQLLMQSLIRTMLCLHASSQVLGQLIEKHRVQTVNDPVAGRLRHLPRFRIVKLRCRQGIPLGSCSCLGDQIFVESSS